jgi:hypothetical protein
MIGYYFDIGLELFKPCHVDCKTCSGPGADECESAYPYAYLILGVGPSAVLCQAGYMTLTNHSNCVSIICDPTCGTCVGPAANQCQSCHTNAELLASAPNICKCKDGFDEAPDSSNCIAGGCHDSCKKCKGNKEDECQECYTNASLDGE